MLLCVIPTFVFLSHINSDHASWTRAGYASCHPFESQPSDSNRNIHTPEDTLDKLTLEHSVQFAYIALGWAVEMSLD